MGLFELMDVTYLKKLMVIILLIVYILYYFRKNNIKPVTQKQYMKKINLYYSKKKWEKTINLSVEALNKFKLNTEEKIYVNLTIANCYYELHQYSSALDYYNVAFELTFSYNKKYNYAESFLYAIDTLIRLDMFIEAKNLYHKIISNAENISEFKKLIKFAEKNKF